MIFMINGVENEDASAPDGFTEVGGSMEGSASMVNQSDALPDNAAAQGAADPVEAGGAVLDSMINPAAE